MVKVTLCFTLVTVSELLNKSHLNFSVKYIMGTILSEIEIKQIKEVTENK